MKTKLEKLFTIPIALLMMIMLFPFCQSANAASSKTLAELKAKFPGGKYWNHQVNNASQYGDVLFNNGDDSFADSVTDYPCATHAGTPAIGQYDCNVFQRSMQCCGFAKKLAYDAYGSYTTDWPQTNSLNSLKAGDVLHYYGQGADPNAGHWVMVTGVNGDSITVGECNVLGHNCIIQWDRVMYKSKCSSATVFVAPSELTIDTPTPSKPALTIKSGTSETDTVLSWNSCSNTNWYDIRLFHDGEKNSFKDTFKYQGTSFKTVLPAGKYYATVASVNSNGKYTFSDSVSFTVAEPPVKGKLSVTPDPKTGKTKFEWLINGKAASITVNITNQDTSDTSTINRKTDQLSAESSLNNGNYTAVLQAVNASGTKTVIDTVAFKVGETKAWTYCSTLPSDITDTVAEIEYNEPTKKVASTSPGEGWVKGDLAKTVFENKGEPYQSNIELPTSDTRVLLSYYYYHYCGASKGNEANYEKTSVFPHFCSATADSFTVASSGLDSADNRYKWYRTKWNGTDIWGKCETGTTCDGSDGGSHGARCDVWYKCSTYQDKVAVSYYNYTLPSATWSSKTKAANAIGVRYSLNSSKAEVAYGDANCDGTVDLSDAVIIMQSISNPSKYGVEGTDETRISEQGRINADCCNAGDGVTNLDALAIQKYKLSLITSLPEKK